MWTSSEWEKVVRLRAEGLTLQAIAPRIGRPFHQLRHKVRWETMTPEQRETRAAKIRSYKKAFSQTVKTDRQFEMVRRSARPTLEAIDDRERRHAAGPRDLTGAFFGDPPVGFSALEQRA